MARHTRTAQKIIDKYTREFKTEVLNLELVSRFLGVSPATVRRYIDKGRLEGVRTNGDQRTVTISALLDFLAACYKGVIPQELEACLRWLDEGSMPISDAADIIGVCVSTLRRKADRYEIPSFTYPGGQRRFKLCDLMAHSKTHS